METLLTRHAGKLLAAMGDVKHFETRLARLNDWWGKLTLIGKINSHNVASTILDDMNRTQSKFGELQQKLTHSLLVENLQKLVLDNASRAQVAIDLLIRNLFERTADVGFLATDDDIRQFLSQSQTDANTVEFIENRLREYVKKYSVYDEIIIFDPNGKVRAHLDAENPISQGDDPLIAETLQSPEDYVETFRYSNLQANRRHSLIYSCKITETDNKHSNVLGVLCLCFRFDNEMQGIFANLLTNDDNGILCIVDADNRVIASSSEHVIPVHSKLHKVSTIDIVNIKSRDYIINARDTHGYQGFFGLGWRGVMLMPLESAFKPSPATEFNQAHNDVMEQTESFPRELKAIRQASADINADLGLLVLNGKIASARKNAAEFMPVLEAIKQVGSDIADIFTASVNTLQQVTVMSSHLNNAGFLASLAVDIMDRNLYERANDCRWWALTSAFRRNLAKPVLSNQDKVQMSDILRYINGLYTVYTNLYVYDAHGEILAVSDPKQTHLIGTVLDDASGFRSTLQRADSQQYNVSDFRQTSLYDQRQTYIYNAAITDLDSSRKVLGGIGIVFDSEPQFAAMLTDILPRAADGALVNRCFALFTNRNRRILATANTEKLTIGATLFLDDAYFKLGNGKTLSTIIRYDNSNYVLGVASSKGYREYKTVDDYHNDIVAFVFIPI